MPLISREQARRILTSIAADTRIGIEQLAQKEGVVFDTTRYSDAQILKAMLQAAGVKAIFDNAGAGEVIDQLPALLEETR